MVHDRSLYGVDAKSISTYHVSDSHALIDPKTWTLYPKFRDGSVNLVANSAILCHACLVAVLACDIL